MSTGATPRNALRARDPSYHNLVLLGLVGFVLPVLLAPLWPAVHRLWTETLTYSHGYLVLLAGLWLAWVEWRRAPLGRPAPSLAGLVVLAAVTGVAVAARAADVGVAQQLAIPALAVTFVWAAAGAAIARRFAAPAGYLLFAVSAWDFANEPLRVLTTNAVTVLLRLTDIPAFIEGNLISVPSGTFEVEGGCSGLHYVIVGGALGVFYALEHYRSWRPRALLVGVAFAIALVANWGRVFLLVVVGHLTEMQHYLVTVDHYYFGWVLFLLAMALLIPAGRRIEALDGGAVRAEPAGTRTRSTTHDRLVSVGTLAVAVLGAGLLYAESIPRRTPAELRVEARRAAGWSPVAPWGGATRPAYVGADAESAYWYERGADRVGVYLAYYADQAQGREIVYFENRAHGRIGEVTERTRRSAAGSDFTEFRVRGPSRERLVWRHMRVAGIPATTSLRAKVLQALGSVRGRRDASVLVLAADCDPDCASARSMLDDFALDAMRHVLNCTVRSVHGNFPLAGEEEQQPCD